MMRPIQDSARKTRQSNAKKLYEMIRDMQAYILMQALAFVIGEYLSSSRGTVELKNMDKVHLTNIRLLIFKSQVTSMKTMSSGPKTKWFCHIPITRPCTVNSLDRENFRTPKDPSQKVERKTAADVQNEENIRWLEGFSSQFNRANSSHLQKTCQKAPTPP